MADHFSAGIVHFNAKRFFEAHEKWEIIWLKSEGKEKIFLQGLIQCAAAFHHFQSKNSKGAQSLLEKGEIKIKKLGESHRGLNLKALHVKIATWKRFFQDTTQEENPPSFPHL